MIFAENNRAAYKCNAFQPFTVSFKAAQCFTGCTDTDADKALRLLMPHCPQTIPGSLLDPNFSSVWFRL